MKIVLIKQTDDKLEGEQAKAVRGFLFQFFKGATVADEKGWRRFIRAMHDGVAGEYFQFTVERQRLGWAHRKHMALEGKIFNAQERIGDIKQFRAWSYIGCGWCDWFQGSKGGVVPVPKSISFDKCSEEEADQMRTAFITFMRTQHAQHFLFPHLTPQMAEQCMESIIQPFEAMPNER